MKKSSKNKKKRTMLLIFVSSLGCAKNQVDTEEMLGLILPRGCSLCADPEEADLFIVNTCGFIDSAKEESIQTILELANRKSDQQKFVVCGCLSQRYRDDLKTEIPEVDEWLAIDEKSKISVLIDLWFPNCLSSEKSTKRILINPPHYAYLRVADGCNHLCSFCAIPGIRGKFASLKINDIVAQTQELVEKGVKEINVIAQDTSFYGNDINKSLPDLLKNLVKVDGIDWIRLQYLFPASVTDELINIIANEEKIVKYIDMPIQHISQKILKSMKRPGEKFSRNLLSKIKNIIPDVGFRTAVIVGYPEETQSEFEELFDFISEFKFNHLGVFEYSQEEGTSAFSLGDPISAEEKEIRKDKIMMLQQRISLNCNKEFIGKTIPILIDEINETGEAIGRRQIDAPGVDNIVHISNTATNNPGGIIPIKITKVEPYDLWGSIQTS